MKEIHDLSEPEKQSKIPTIAEENQAMKTGDVSEAPVPDDAALFLPDKMEDVPAIGEMTKPEIPPSLSKKRSASRPIAAGSPPAKQHKTLSNAAAPRRRNPIRPVYEDIWSDVYLAGTEWDQLKVVYSIDWDFDHLDEALTDGSLSDKTIHLFGCTEPQLLMRDKNDSKGHVIPVPVIVAIVSDVAPPSVVGIKSVQRAEEEIVSMADVRMGWHAYAPENVSHRRRFKPKVHILKCNERQARLKNMGEAEVHKYDYVLPYFIRPEEINDVTVDTVVQVLALLEGRSAPLMCEFDYDMDDLEEFVEETITENELDKEKHTSALTDAIRQAVKATKLKYKAEQEERKKRIDEFSQEQKDAIKSVKLFKFYPANEWPDVSNIKSRYINRYYGQATEVY